MVKAQKLALCIDIFAESDSRSVVNIPERLGFQPLPTSGRLARRSLRFHDPQYGKAVKETASEAYCAWEGRESSSGMTFTFRIACFNRASATIATCHEYLS
jgi:hypothetical protein